MNHNNKPSTVAEYFKSLKILFGAFILGVINLGIVILVLFFLDMLPLEIFDEGLVIYFILISMALLVVMTYLGNRIFISKTKSGQEEFTLADKLSAYREGKLIQVVTMEASALIAMVFLMIATHVFFLVVAGLSLIQMIRVFPKKQEMIDSLALSYSDQQKLNNPDFELS